MNPDVKIKEFQALKAGKFGRLKTLKVTRGEDIAFRDNINDYMNLFLEFTSEEKEMKTKRLEMEFNGVRQLKIGSLGMGHWYLLRIDSIKDNQMEDLNYKVVEAEENVFSFYCRDFTAKICDQ